MTSQVKAFILQYQYESLPAEQYFKTIRKLVVPGAHLPGMQVKEQDHL